MLYSVARAGEGTATGRETCRGVLTQRQRGSEAVPPSARRPQSKSNLKLSVAPG
ncbi:MAG TPA: hypothetical protein VGB76_21190 [Pyrinomonadaceae bacterium]